MFERTRQQREWKADGDDREPKRRVSRGRSAARQKFTALGVVPPARFARASRARRAAFPPLRVSASDGTARRTLVVRHKPQIRRVGSDCGPQISLQLLEKARNRLGIGEGRRSPIGTFRGQWRGAGRGSEVSIVTGARSCQSAELSPLRLGRVADRALHRYAVRRFGRTTLLAGRREQALAARLFRDSGSRILLHLLEKAQNRLGIGEGAWSPIGRGVGWGRGTAGRTVGGRWPQIGGVK